MKNQNQKFSDRNNFEAVYKSAFFLERKNVASPKPSQKYHYHDCYELYYLYSGERYYFIKDKTYHVDGGSFVLIKPYEIHCSANFAQYGYDRLLINFKKDYLDKFLGAMEGTNPFECFEKDIHTIILTPHEQHFVELMLDNMLSEYQSENALDNVYLKTCLMQLLLFINNHRHQKIDSLYNYANSTHKTISEITGYINNNYYEDITLSLISELFYISPCYFSRTFKKVCGLSFTEYLNNVRIKEARKLLYKTDMSIAQIADKTGFKSNAHFDRIFKSITGVSPLTYKKSIKYGPSQFDQE